MKNVYIIAEAGVNHNGCIDLAKKMILEAKKAGADAVKFQTFDAESVVTKTAQKADYQIQNTGNNGSQYLMLKNLELNRDEFLELKNLCSEVGIDFMSSPFDGTSVDLLLDLNIDTFKIPSGEITNYPLLVKIANTKKPIIMSTGMATLEEIREAINVLEKNGANNISLLHCTTEYPTPYEEVNLRALQTLSTQFLKPVGYSDHTRGIEVSIAAVALGAKIIEKHFTLDRKMVGPDHKASLEPTEFALLVSSIRNVEKSLGDGVKKPTCSEQKNVKIARKSIVAKRNIQFGEKFTSENITTKRPGIGLSPMLWNKVIGTGAKKNFEQDELIEL